MESTEAEVENVKWRGNSRQGNLSEVFEMMTIQVLNGIEVEGEDSLRWFLDKVGPAGAAAHPDNWMANNHIPAGGRSVRDYVVTFKVFKAVAEVDQLNLPALKSFEWIGRRAQVPEDVVGRGPQKGSALVAPSTVKNSTTKARERAEVTKQRRKLGEEMNLRGRPKGGKNAAVGATAEGA